MSWHLDIHLDIQLDLPNPPKPPMWICECGTRNEDFRNACRNCRTARN